MKKANTQITNNSLLAVISQATRPLVLSALVLLGPVTQAVASPIVNFNAADLSVGDVSTAEVQKASVQPDNLSQKPFNIKSKADLRLEVVSEGNSAQALRVHLPSSLEGSCVYGGFRDPQLADILAPEKPLVFSTRLKATPSGVAVFGEAIFSRDDQLHAVCLFRTPTSTKAQVEPSFDLPEGEVVDVQVTLLAQDAGIAAKFQAKAPSGFSDEREWVLPKTENYSLRDIQFLNLVLSSDPSAGDAFIDLVSFAISQ
jgi:hypothetical protein